MNLKQALEERLINFSVLIIGTVNRMKEDRVSYHLGGQLLRSGTSPALNYGEAMGAESRKDFIHKLGVILKELRESHNCLRILSMISYIQSDDLALIECNELISIFVTSIKTARKNVVQ
jgi:four helix bundle protein